MRRSTSQQSVQRHTTGSGFVFQSSNPSGATRCLISGNAESSVTRPTSAGLPPTRPPNRSASADRPRVASRSPDTQRGLSSPHRSTREEIRSGTMLCRFCRRPVGAMSMTDHLKSACQLVPVQCTYATTGDPPKQCSIVCHGQGHLAEHQSVCPLRPVPCLNAPHCSAIVCHDDMESHLASCGEQHVGCKHCGARLRRKKQISHSSVCGDTPVPCPLRCGLSVTRSTLMAHLTHGDFIETHRYRPGPVDAHTTSLGVGPALVSQLELQPDSPLNVYSFLFGVIERLNDELQLSRAREATSRAQSRAVSRHASFAVPLDANPFHVQPDGTIRDSSELAPTEQHGTEQQFVESGAQPDVKPSGRSGRKAAEGRSSSVLSSISNDSRRGADVRLEAAADSHHPLANDVPSRGCESGQPILEVLELLAELETTEDAFSEGDDGFWPLFNRHVEVLALGWQKIETSFRETLASASEPTSRSQTPQSESLSSWQGHSQFTHSFPLPHWNSSDNASWRSLSIASADHRSRSFASSGAGSEAAARRATVKERLTEIANHFKRVQDSGQRLLRFVESRQTNLRGSASQSNGTGCEAEQQHLADAQDAVGRDLRAWQRAFSRYKIDAYRTMWQDMQPSQ